MRNLAAIALVAAVGFPAAAQVGPAPDPTAQSLANRARVTSSITATAPTPAEQREARSLVTAIFAKPAAAQRAADKAAPQTPPNLETSPKPEWTTSRNGLGLGGKGVQFKAPF